MCLCKEGMGNTGNTGWQGVTSEAGPSHQHPHSDLRMFLGCMDKSKKGRGFCLLPEIPLVLPVHAPQ